MKTNCIYNQFKAKYNKNMDKVAEEIMRKYIELGSFGAVSRYMGTSRENLCRLLKSRLDYLSKSNKRLYKQYLEKTQETEQQRIRKAAIKAQQARLNKKEKLIPFNERSFKELPETIKYNDFLNWCIVRNTGDLSGVKLVQMANQNGVKVIG